MFSYIWPVALVIVCNTIYQICVKEAPEINPMASLTITYAVSTVTSLILFFILNRGETTLISEYSKLNWSSIVLGIILVGIEAGWIYVYRAGWLTSTAAIVVSDVLSIILIAVGVLIYKEDITLTKVIGIVICMVGMYFINK